MKVLITGGAGYIGSHVAHALCDMGHEVVILDNFYSGQRRAVPTKATLIEGNAGDEVVLDKIFANHQFSALLHFAAHIEVGESVLDPAKYYRNNTANSLTLFTACLKHGISNLIFSSTAAVYGEPDSDEGLSENLPLKPVNPYGASKQMTERILSDLASSSGNAMKFVILRYFNAAGARRDLAVGQATPRATHLIKLAAQAALGIRDGISVFGSDYPTVDGTCLRDYVHIEDLAQAHIDALSYLDAGGASEIFNVGYGRAHSVLEVIESMQRVSSIKLHVTRAERRAGDASTLMANCVKIQRVLKWQPKFNDLDLICKTAYEWEKKLQDLRKSGEWR